MPNHIKRIGSERIKDGAKNFIKRVESIKSRRKKKKNREGVIISGPIHLDLQQLQKKFQSLTPRDIKTCKSSTTSPLVMSPVINSPAPLFLFTDSKVCPKSEVQTYMFGQNLLPNQNLDPKLSQPHFKSQNYGSYGKSAADDSSSLCSEISLDSGNEGNDKNLLFANKHRRKDDGAFSDSEALKTREKKPSAKHHKSSSLVRGSGSLNLGRDSNIYRENTKVKHLKRSKSGAKYSGSPHEIVPTKLDSTGQWHSFRTTNTTNFNDLDGVALCKLSCGQIEKLRKLALVTLTGYMERYFFNKFYLKMKSLIKKW
jgi:deleted in liver cancer protein